MNVLRTDEPPERPGIGDAPDRWKDHGIVIFANGRIEHWTFIAGAALVLVDGGGREHRFHPVCADDGQRATRVFVEHRADDPLYR